MVEGLREGILNLIFKEMSLDILRTYMESFIIFKDRLNNLWVIKPREYCWKKVGQNEWFFFVKGFLVLKGKLLIWLYMNVL